MTDKTATYLRQKETSETGRDRYWVFIEDLPDGFYETDLKGNFKRFNTEFCRIFGYARNEIQDRNYREFMDEEKAGIVFECFNKIYHAQKRDTGIAWEIIRKNKEMLTLEISANLMVDEKGQKAGFRGIVRDVTEERRIARTNQALFRIAKALHRFRGLDERLDFIIKEIKKLIGVEGASVILLDEEKKEFFFRVVTYDDTEAGRILKEVRFPSHEGVAGHVCRTGQAMIVSDTTRSPCFFRQVDEQSGYRTRNMLDVPIQTQDRMIGVLCAVNKKKGEFDQTDIELLNTVASTVALPIENARINGELRRSYKEVQSLNRAKERVIHHLSHELKTPVSVLDASLKLIRKNIFEFGDLPKMTSLQRLLDRAQRNSDRILEMQYQIEDILKKRDYRSHRMLSTLLDACTDELESLFECELRSSPLAPCPSPLNPVIQIIRDRVEELFGPHDAVSQKIELGGFIEENIRTTRPHFAHRECLMKFMLHPSALILRPYVLIPPEILSKIAQGLIRNAVENTPDQGLIKVMVRHRERGPELSVRDFGVGITDENQKLIFESNFTTHETMQYSSQRPYHFNAGGKGFDLLRMKIFSERYHFNIQMISKRCAFVPRDQDICPGTIDACGHCNTVQDCLHSGGTTMTVRFSPATEEHYEKKRPGTAFVPG